MEALPILLLFSSAKLGKYKSRSLLCVWTVGIKAVPIVAFQLVYWIDDHKSNCSLGLCTVGVFSTPAAQLVIPAKLQTSTTASGSSKVH